MLRSLSEKTTTAIPIPLLTNLLFPHRQEKARDMALTLEATLMEYRRGLDERSEIPGFWELYHRILGDFGRDN